MNEQILIVEDEPYIVESLRFFLERAGYSTVSENDGATATAQVRKLMPAVVILDLMLPNKNGFEILKEIKGAPDLMKTPVMVLTAKGQKHDHSTAAQLHADAFITKPFSNREVLAGVEKLLGMSAGADR